MIGYDPSQGGDYRLYLQFKPDKSSLQYFISLTSLLKAGRPVVPRQLHVTLLHIGKISYFSTFIQTNGGELAKASLYTLIADFNALLDGFQGQLLPQGLDLFGENKRTLVIRFGNTPYLDTLHATALDMLVNFLKSCGIKDPFGAMSDDHNFMYALSMRPHLTIAKGFYGSLPELPLKPIFIEATPIVFPPVAK